MDKQVTCLKKHGSLPLFCYFGFWKVQLHQIYNQIFFLLVIFHCQQRNFWNKSVEDPMWFYHFICNKIMAIKLFYKQRYIWKYRMCQIVINFGSFKVLIVSHQLGSFKVLVVTGWPHHLHQKQVMLFIISICKQCVSMN